jgi:protein subunit release factor B
MNLHENIINQKLSDVEKNNNHEYWWIKLVHASGHGGQNINHGNSKAQLFFDINKFFEIFDISDDEREKFVKIVGIKKIHHDNTVLVLDNQETRYAETNKVNVLRHLINLLREFLQEDMERIETKVPLVVKEERMKDKKFNAKKKEIEK